MFIWKKEFELGIESIDNQHKKLLEIGNRVNDLLAIHSDDKNYDEIIKVIEDLKDYTIYHFKTEEDLFIKYNYTEYNQHKKEHEGFTQYINSVNYNLVEENQGIFLENLLKKIVNWVFQHIITSDYMYKDYLITLGAK